MSDERDLPTAHDARAASKQGQAPWTDDGRPAPARDDAAASMLEVVRAVVADARPSAAPTVRLDSRFDADLGLDSLAVAELLVRVEETFDASLPDETLVRVETPGDVLDELAAAPAAVNRAAGRPRTRLAPIGPAADGVAPAQAGSLVEVLAWHANQQPDRTHIRLLGEGGPDEELTYGQLWHEAAVVAAGLRQRAVAPGASVAIMLPTCREYFLAYIGVLLAGCVPVPIYPPAKPSALEEHLRRQARLLDNARAPVLITVPDARALARLVAPNVATLQHVVTVADLAVDAAPSPPTMPDPHATALVQYTSGSTGDPKGVVLSHANLLANIRAMGQAGHIDDTDVFVSWLPLYHDMGLIGSWLLSLYFGLPFNVMSPLAFLARPVRWLQAISTYGGTLSGGPNFGYELCLRRVDDDDLEQVDLSSWRIGFNGAEPVSPETVTGFVDRFAHVGLRPGAMTPVYGLAETAVALTIPQLDRGPVIDRVAREPLATSGRATPAADEDPAPARFVACGRALPGHEVRIADDHGTSLGERQEGRVEFRGPSATLGYLRNPEATERLFDGDWRDSGDLGYLADGELYLTGRVKDVIIRGGRNLHPSELEEAVGDLDDVRKGCVAVFPTVDPDAGTERLVVLAETRIGDPDDRERLQRQINEAVVDVVGGPPDEVVLAGPGAVPKTSSGKIRRNDARARYERGQLGDDRSAVWWQVARLALTSLPAWARRIGGGFTRGVYGVYVHTLFLLAAVIVYPLVAVVPGLARRWAIVRRAGRLLLGLAGIRISVRGAGSLPTDGSFVVVANHASFIDPLVLALALPEPPVFVGAGGLAKRPLVHRFVKRLGTRLLQPGDRAQRVEESREFARLVRSGQHVTFFPEGRRSPAPGLEPFRMGAFLTAANAGVPVVPIALRGTREVLPVGRRLVRRGAIGVSIGEPVRTRTAGWAGAVELHGAARTELIHHLDEPDLA